MNRIKRRSNLGISDNNLNEYLQVIVNLFTEEWLVKSGINPIQILWNRNDELATNELYTFASALTDLSKIDLSWTKDIVKKAKLQEKNNNRGAILEILTLGMMNAPMHPVKPARKNQAGYDGVLTTPTGINFRISIKNYGASEHQLKFERKAKAIENKILELLKKYNYPPTQVFLEFSAYYPEVQEWKLLYEKIEDIFRIKRNDVDPFSALMIGNIPVFFLGISPLENQDLFHSSFKSYTIIVVAAFHKNEHSNIFSKIDSACANIIKHSTEGRDGRNALFLKLPSTISLAKCAEWVNDYFTTHFDKPISTVFLYQTTVAYEISNNKELLYHSFQMLENKNRETPNLVPPIGTVTFTIPVGSVSSESSRPGIKVKRADGTEEFITTDDRYFYQHGEHIMKMVPDGTGAMGGNLRKLANGIIQKLVIEFPTDPGKRAVIEPRLPGSDDLLIL